MLVDVNGSEVPLAAPAEAATHQPPGYSSDKEAYLRRLKRTEGQVRGIARMVDEDTYCIDILTQVPAVTKALRALRALSLGLVEEHVVGATAEPDPALRAEAIDVKVTEARMRSAACCASGNPTHHHTVGLVTPRPSTDKEPTMSTVSTTVNVSGMTCGHCVSSVSEELEALAGVETVDVDLNAGGVSTVTITSTEELSSAEIGEAVAEAGYLVVANEA
jgi:copper chaperone